MTLRNAARMVGCSGGSKGTRSGSATVGIKSPLRFPLSSVPKRWYFIHTYANFENKVADPRVCEGRYLDYLFEEIIVPTENLLDVRHGQKHATERRFSPSCALAKMGLTDEAYHLIKNSQRSPLRWLPQKAELEFNRRRSSYTARGDHRRLRLRVDSQSSVFRLSSPDL